jgi:chromatin segregation and condensation protein Rec8/ScpA/Scc1 (kleisin family)
MSTDTNSARLNHLLQAAAEIARAENREPEDVLTDALAQYESNKKLTELGAYGRAKARRTGLKPSDVDREISAHRQATRLR